MDNVKKTFVYALCIAWLAMLASCSLRNKWNIYVVDRPDVSQVNANYVANRQPLLPSAFIKLPPGSIEPSGWVKKMLELQRDGLCGKLNETSIWVDRKNSAWLEPDKRNGWEEMPYWLKGYSNLAYVLKDQKMIDETMVWIEGALRSQREDGFFGPVNRVNRVQKEGSKEVLEAPELWAQMIMLWCLQDYYEYSGDQRVIDLMTRFFKWELSVPDEVFLENYWENSRGGDNLLSVLWLYNRTGDDFLLELAEKVHRNTANWTQTTNLPNWHNVNVAQCFREPATYYIYNKEPAMLQATYDNHNLIRKLYGQVPGGMFGGDENSRAGHADPHQGVENCGMVEQMASDEILLRLTGDMFWAENCEDVAFNTLPASYMPDMRSLRYITSPNLAVADAANHHPGLDNGGAMLSMSGLSYRCCRHNHGQGWPYYAENLVYATPDGGAALVLYASNKTTMKVADGQEITITESGNYPFDDRIYLTINTQQDVAFPLYLRIPTWAKGASIRINETPAHKSLTAGKYIRIDKAWEDGDQIELRLPMSVSLRRWEANKNSVSVDYGPLTFSLKIGEKYTSWDGLRSQNPTWQEGVNPNDWAGYEIKPTTDWNYALGVDGNGTSAGFSVARRAWPRDNNPFTVEGAPLVIHANGSRIPTWGIDEDGLCGTLPEPGFRRETEEPIELIPMGAARLRISAFPNYER